MDWNSVDSTELIVQWRRFRLDLDSRNLPKDEILNEVAKYWASVPRGSRCVDYYTAGSWPTPWQILNDKLYCESTVSLMIYYTLQLLETYDSELEIVLVEDSVDEYLAVIAENKHILNYEYGSVCNLESLPDISIIQRFKEKEIPEID